MNLRGLIKEHLILEKRIGQISTDMSVTFNFEIDRTPHAEDRSTREYLGNKYNQRPIENNEIKELLSKARRDITEYIVTRKITPNKAFVVRSEKYELSVPINPRFMGGTHWKLYVMSAWRESAENQFRVGPEQLVIDVE